MSAAETQLQIRKLTDPNQIPAEWSRFVESDQSATVFHTAGWQRVIARSYGYQFCGLMALDGKENVVGVLPAFRISSVLTGRRLVSSPFSYICGPLGENDNVRSALLRALVAEAQSSGASYLELKSLSNLPALESLIESRHYTTFHVDLAADEETILANTHKSQIQRGIKKAQKEGVEIAVHNDEQGISEFHRLNLTTCRAHGIPAQPKKFHTQVLTELGNSGQAEYLLARYQGKAIAGIVVFTHGDTAIYMYGASDPDYLQQRPNHLLLWEAIVAAKRRGLRTFDLGRVSPDNTGLREFKERWGAKALPLHYYYWPQVKGVGSVDRNSLKYKLSTFIFSKLPIAVTGNFTWLYKHLG